MEQSVEQSAEQGVEQSVEQNVEQCLEQSLEQRLEQARSKCGASVGQVWSKWAATKKYFWATFQAAKDCKLVDVINVKSSLWLQNLIPHCSRTTIQKHGGEGGAMDK